MNNLILPSEAKELGTLTEEKNSTEQPQLLHQIEKNQYCTEGGEREKQLLIQPSKEKSIVNVGKSFTHGPLEL